MPEGFRVRNPLASLKANASCRTRLDVREALGVMPGASRIIAGSILEGTYERRAASRQVEARHRCSLAAKSDVVNQEKSRCGQRDHYDPAQSPGVLLSSESCRGAATNRLKRLNTKTQTFLPQRTYSDFTLKKSLIKYAEGSWHPKGPLRLLRIKV